MGVTGLLPQLKEIQENATLERYRGKRLAIDSYSWLHKGVFSCSWELAQDLPTQKYLSYFQKKVQMLRHFQIRPYFVFDGDDFISKKDTELERSQSRKLNKQRGLELLERGDRKAASEYFTRCVDVTPSMAKTVIDYLRAENIDYIVAPYEADAQMVYLEKLGLVDGIISEDSDLLIFGAQALLTKLNESGEFIEIRRENFKKCKSVPIGLMNDSQLRMVACLSGCDYTNGIPGIGIVKAIRLVRRLSNMKKCLMSLKLEGKVKVPNEFELEYAKADLSFQYQRVFNPLTNEITTLNEIKDIDKDNELLEECIGQLHDVEIHYKISIGELDPIAKTPLVSRENSIRSMSQPLPFSVTPKSTMIPRFVSATTAKKLKTPSKPKLKSTVQGIDSFFKNKSTPTTMRTKSLPTPTLSPTSKRIRLFNPSLIIDENDPAAITKCEAKVSRFFQSTTLPVPRETKEVHETIFDHSSKERAIADYGNSHSSDFELTDIDEEDKNDAKVGGKDESAEPSAGDFDDEDESISDSPLSHSIPNSKRLLKELEETPSKQHEYFREENQRHKEVKRGLFDKFGFGGSRNIETQTTAHSSKVLKPIRQFENKPRMSTVLTKSRGQSKPVKTLTLDSFIYRG